MKFIDKERWLDELFEEARHALLLYFNENPFSYIGISDFVLTQNISKVELIRIGAFPVEGYAFAVDFVRFLICHCVKKGKKFSRMDLIEQNFGENGELEPFYKKKYIDSSRLVVGTILLHLLVLRTSRSN